MDPLDQRLFDAGSAWRQSQPESPDLDRMVVALRRQRSGFIQRRLMYAFVAGLLLMAAIAVAPGVGGFLHLNQAPVPVATASPSATPAPSTPTPSPSTTPKPEPSAPAALTDAERATELVHKYEDGLVSGRWQAAFDLLAPTSLTHQAGFASFREERAAFFDSVNGRYTIGEPSRVTDWTDYAPLVEGADRSRAWLIQVDYPALAGNNAGFEQFVVAPDAGGTWRIWPVR
ncbi:MAG TPA: hypothetical protein VFJ71_12605 [Candidatus Limnocylindrales bacterium]|nr:hypothetical protein [Candidatus Limnocylindrales bacterium]